MPMRVRSVVIVNGQLAKLRELAKLTPGDLTLMVEKTDREFRRYEKDLFVSQGAVAGRPWPALEQRYARQKARKYPGRGILVRTGQMKRAFTTAASSEHVARGRLLPNAVIELGVEGRSGFLGHIHRAEARKRRDAIDLSDQEKGKLLGIVRRILLDKLRAVNAALARGAARLRAA